MSWQRALAFLAGLYWAIGPLCAAQSVQVRPAAPAAEPIPDLVLQKMYQQELGPLYAACPPARLREAHELIERYFAETRAPERKTLARQLETLGLEANVLGRLVRLRLRWPELDSGVYSVNERAGRYEMKYFFGIPAGYDRTRPWPVVIKLPGVHAFLTDPPPTEEQATRLYATWTQDELRAHGDAVVLIPRLDVNELWGPSYKGMNSVVQPLLHLTERVNVDPSQVYLMGHAASAHGAWNLALHYPTYFAALGLMTNGPILGFQQVRLSNLRNVPSVLWHGTEDKNVSVDRSRELAKALKEAKCPVEYEEGTGAGHVPGPEVVEKLYKKMRSYRRPLYPRQLALGSNRPDSLFNRSDWLQVYQTIATGDERKLIIVRGSGTMVVQQLPYSIEASITGPNRIDITSKNVQSLRLYLNDQMVDFSRPVEVYIRGVKRFEGLVRTSVEEMLRDQVFLGRGWRYFTGLIDIDLGDPSLYERPATQPGTRPGPPGKP